MPCEAPPPPPPPPPPAVVAPAEREGHVVVALAMIAQFGLHPMRLNDASALRSRMETLNISDAAALRNAVELLRSSPVVFCRWCRVVGHATETCAKYLRRTTQQHTQPREMHRGLTPTTPAPMPPTALRPAVARQVDSEFENALGRGQLMVDHRGIGTVAWPPYDQTAPWYEGTLDPSRPREHPLHQPYRDYTTSTVTGPPPVALWPPPYSQAFFDEVCPPEYRLRQGTLAELMDLAGVKFNTD